MSRELFKGFLSLFGSQAFDPLLGYTSFPQTVVPCPVSRSEKFAEALEQLNLFRDLGQNWDGYGGARIGEQAIERARSLLTNQLYSRATLGLPEITPTSNGTLVIEWQGSKGEAAVEIGNTRLSGVIKPENSPTICIVGDTATVVEYLPTFIAPFLNPEPPKAAAITPVEYNIVGNG